MKKLIIASTILFLTTIIFIHQEALATNRIFLLDTSGSMKRGGLFDKIKETLKTDYVSKMKAGEHIVILTYDEKVVIFVDQEIRGEEDVRKITSNIDNLKAIGLWTWMTKALETTMEQAKRMKSQYPQEPLIIYFLTDGINEPPPATKEPMLKFVEVLWKYFEGFKMEDAYVYVLVYKEEGQLPVVTKEDEEKIKRETEGQVIIESPSFTSDEPIPPEIHIGYSGFDFGVVNLSRGEVTKKGSIGIKELKGDNKGRIVKLCCETEPFPKFISFGVSPDSIEVLKEGQMEKIGIQIPHNLSSGEYVPTLKLSSDGVLISPNKIPVKFKAIKANGGQELINILKLYIWDRIWKIWKPLMAILILALLYLLLLILRTRSLWVQREGQEDRHQIKVRNMKKNSLEEVGLSNYQVGFGIFPQELFSVFLFRGEEKERKIIVGESVKCKDQQGHEITIIFHSKSSKTKPEESMPDTREEKDPDFFRKEEYGLIDFSSDEYKGDIK